MKRFAHFVRDLDQTNRTSEKVEVIARYIRDEEPASAAWAVWLLAGERLKRTLSSKVLWNAAIERSGMPRWMLDACYEAVGDASETIAMVLPPAASPQDLAVHVMIERFVLPLRGASERDATRLLQAAWDVLDGDERFAFHKLLSGTFRMGVQRGMLARALAQVAGVPLEVMLHRLMGRLDATPAGLARLLDPNVASGNRAKPYPFALANQLVGDPSELGDASRWVAEWKWDGVRAQLIARDGVTMLFSRGEEHVGVQFPEVLAVAKYVAIGTVLDGEVLAWRMRGDEGPLSFQHLQRRIGRKDVQPGLFDDEGLVFMAFDCLEAGGVDVRARAWRERREMLEEIVAKAARGGAPIRLSPTLRCASWEEFAALRQQAEERGHAEGLMLKAMDGVYPVGRARGRGARADDGAERAEGEEDDQASDASPAVSTQGWWKWKLDPYEADMVLIASQPGSGRRAGLFTDHTFGVWDGDVLVPIAKAYSGLSDVEIMELDAFIRSHTTARAGPVRLVEPTQVFQVHFQEVHESSRHKSGLAVRFPRIARWRRDKAAREAATLASMRVLLEQSLRGRR